MATPEDNLDPFVLWCEIQDVEVSTFAKGEGHNGSPPEVFISGVVSADVVDADGETVNQDGIDWSRFLKYGRITDGHPYSNDRVVGDPVEIKRITVNGVPATFMKASLHMWKKRAQKLYDDHRMAVKAGRRGLGFSIEGHATQRTMRGFRIEKSVVTSVAIDAQPKNRLSLIDPIAAGLAGSMRSIVMGEEASGATTEALRRMMDPTFRRRADMLKGLSERDILVAHLAKTNPGLRAADISRLINLRRNARHQRRSS